MVQITRFSYVYKIWLLAGLGGVVFVAVFSVMPPPASSIPSMGLIPQRMHHGVPPDKWLHVSVYFFLTLWFLQLCRAKRFAGCLLAFTLLGLVLEVLQAFYPMRQTDFLDLLANLAGIMLAWQLALIQRISFCVYIEKLLRRFF